MKNHRHNRRRAVVEAVLMTVALLGCGLAIAGEPLFSALGVFIAASTAWIADKIGFHVWATN